MEYEQIIFEQRGRVALLTLNRPEKLNAWTSQMMGELADAIERANRDDSIRAIVTTGAGRAYCAGADIGGFQAGIQARESGGERDERGALGGLGGWVTFLRGMPKPTIAAINGPAVGIGITHILPFDIRIASETARIGMFFVKMGLVPELASSHFLAQLCGTGRALEWCLTGRMIPADEACAAGLVTEVVAPERLVDRALELGEQVGSQPTSAVGLIKQLFYENALETDVVKVMEREGKALATAYTSWEHKEAVAAFLEKREPNFAQRKG
jgi:enoyl-CoA hydratase/carnithine racemase